MSSDTGSVDNNQQPEQDGVSAAFARLMQQAQAKRTTDSKSVGGAQQSSTPRAMKAMKARNAMDAAADRSRRRPTGKDGRALPYRRDPLAFGVTLEREIKRRGWKKNIAGGWVHAHWDELVGEKIAQHTRVEMLKDKQLFITCDSTSWASNLRLMQRQILQVIAEKVGSDVIVELKIFGPKAPSWRKGPLHVKGRGPRDTYG